MTVNTEADFSLSRHRPPLRQHLRLFDHRLRGLFLLVRRIAVPAKDALDKAPQVCAYVLAQRPVDGHIVSDRLDELAGDIPERVVPEYLNRTVVRLQRIVEGQFVVGKPQPFAPFLTFTILMYTSKVCCAGIRVNAKREFYGRDVAFCDTGRQPHVHATIIPPPSRLWAAAPIPHSDPLPLGEGGAQRRVRVPLTPDSLSRGE